MPPYQLSCCVDDPPDCEGDVNKQPTLSILVVHTIPSYPRLIVASKHYSCGAPSNQTVYYLSLVCKGDCSKFTQTAYHQAVDNDSTNLLHSVASNQIKLAALRKVKEEGLVHYAAIIIGIVHTISSLPSLLNPSPSLCEGEKIGWKSQPENFGLKVWQDQRIENSANVQIMQSIFGPNITSWPYLRLSLSNISPLVCEGDITPAAHWLLRKTQSISVIIFAIAIIQYRRSCASIL